jgi:hypothetical protein
LLGRVFFASVEGRDMLHVTRRGVAALEELLSVNHVPPDKAIRVVPKDPRGFGLLIDSPRGNDDILRDRHRPVLVADPEVSVQLEERVLDFQPGVPVEAHRFRLLKRHPRQEHRPTLH